MDAARKWALDDGFAVLGREFRIRTTSSSCALLIRRLFSDCAAAVAAGSPAYELVVTERGGRAGAKLTLDGEMLIPNADPPSVLSTLAWRVMNDAVAQTRHLLVVHAGTVAAPGGGAVILPAPSGGGKTTLVAGLLRAGFAYLSDEMAALDPVTGRVLPVPRAMSAKEGSFEALRFDPPHLPSDAERLIDGAWPLRPEDLNAAIGAASPVLAIVVPTFRAGGPAALEPISRATGLEELARNTFNLEIFGPARGLELLARVVRNAACYRLRVDSLDDAVADVVTVVSAV